MQRPEGIASESGCLLGGKGGRHVPLSRRDILRIARRFNAGKHPAWHTSPEGTAEGWRVGLDLSRPFGTRDLFACNPALKRWAILPCPFGTAKQQSSHALILVSSEENLFQFRRACVQIAQQPVPIRLERRIRPVGR